MEALQLGEVFEDLSAACKDAAALLVLNNHERYESFILPESSLPVFDAWQVCKKIDSASTPGNILLEEGEQCAG